MCALSLSLSLSHRDPRGRTREYFFTETVKIFLQKGVTAVCKQIVRPFGTKKLTELGVGGWGKLGLEQNHLCVALLMESVDFFSVFEHIVLALTQFVFVFIETQFASRVRQRCQIMN